jgi:hypothetical protein
MANQRISTGYPYAVYVNETANNQRIAPGIYVNETSGATSTSPTWFDMVRNTDILSRTPKVISTS